MVQRVNVLADKSDNAIPWTHLVGSENQFLQIVLWPPYAHCSKHMCTHAHTQNTCKKFKETLLFGNSSEGRIREHESTLKHAKWMKSDTKGQVG